MSVAFKIPLQSEVEKYIKEKMNWPDNFCRHYADKFWNHYQASGWKLSSGNSIKDWKACFNAQWKVPKFKEDIDLLNGFKPVAAKGTTIGEVSRLDQFLQKYISRPTEIPFSDFGVWYDYLKAENLMRPFTKGEVSELKDLYKGDNLKCRCACVQITLDGYVKSGITFGKIMELRLQLK